MGRVQHEVEEASRMLRQRPCRCLRKTTASTLLPSSKFFLFSFFSDFFAFFRKTKKKNRDKDVDGDGSSRSVSHSQLLPPAFASLAPHSVCRHSTTRRLAA